MKDIANQNDDAAEALAAATQTEGPAAPVVSAILALSRAFGRSIGRDALVDNLPLDTRAEAIENIDALAQRAGLTSKLARAGLDDIPEIALPVLLFLKSGDVALLKKRTRRTAEITLFQDGAAIERSTPLKTLQADYAGYCGYFSAQGLRGDAEADPGFQPPKGGAMAWFWSPVRRLWPNFLQIIVAAMLVNLLALASPLFIMNVYDRVIPSLAIPTLWALTIGIAIAVVFDLILKIARTRIVDETGRRVDMAISGQIFDKILARKLGVETAPLGTTVSRVREFDAVRDVMTSSAVIALTDAVFIGVFLLVLWLIVGPLVLVPAIAVPIVVIATLCLRAPMDRAITASHGDAATRQNVLIETLANLEAAKSAGAGAWLRRRWDRAVAQNSRSTARARFWNNLAVTFVGTVQQTVSIVIIVWGVFLVLDGEVTVGALIAANILSSRVLAPLANISQTLSRLAQARSAARGVSQIMAEETEQPASEGDARLAPQRPTLAFADVSFRYPGADTPALSGARFTIEPGERVGVVGRIGSGKSTMARLLAGLYDPTDGAVLIDGIDTRQIGPASMRALAGFLGQDSELFSGTLRENVTIGRPDASDDEILRAIALSGVQDFAQRHPKGLNMPIVERGRNLSGGQRAAVALARLLIREPQALILDEPTAAMDTTSERAIVAALRSLADEGATLVVATHRDTLLELVDRLIVLDRGSIVLDGPKETVMARLRGAAQAKGAAHAKEAAPEKGGAS